MGSPAQAQLQGATQNIAANIEAETQAPAPGDVVTIAIIMKPKPGWHDYWLNPADAGTPLELEWRLPAGVTAGPVRAPVPETLIVSGFMNHIYRAEHAFLIDLKIAATVQPGQQLPIKVVARWSACSDTICVPEGSELSVNLATGKGVIDSARRSRFDVWRSALPVPLDRQGRYAINGKRIDIAVPYPASAGVGDIWFFARTENLLRYAAPQKARRTGDWLVISTEVERDFDGAIDGLLRLGAAQGLEIRALPGVVPKGGEPVTVMGASAPSENLQTTINFGLILGFSILGGLILNLMPCVFPILGLKALALAKSGGDVRTARRDALAYTSGVIASCVALGGLLLALRAGGEEVGWAFQLQEPRVVLLLLLLMVAVTANLAGLFEIGSIGTGDRLTRIGGLGGSFWTGVLAAVVATPCTGPFMAAALGAALLLPAPQALLLFSGLGFGLALPFLAIAYVPVLQRMLPRPGSWLGTFRKIMAVPMGMTALALLWLLWRVSGVTGLLVAGGLVLVLAILLFQLGKRQRGTVPVGGLIALVVVAAIGAVTLLPNEPVAPSAQADYLKSRPFGEARLAQLRGAGRPVFVYFTADWCVTCKVNEATAIERKATVDAFKKAGIVTLKGDFTQPDPAIARFLAKHGRSGVPLYLYYPAGGQPQILPQILTVETLTGLGS
ncbi:MAG: protein-disulfide reductase DsbD domain-containing protein [Sphingorhabdus sp.]